MRWSRLVLLILLIFDVWYRAHTFGPQVRDALHVNLWPSTVGASEPLDCDEAAYAYIGHRVNRGAVLYRDVTENKTPLGYWLYALAVLVGGYNELTIRIMPIPFVLLTITLVWWIAGRLGGQISACLAAALYVLMSTDPYLFGNGANLEHFVNLFTVSSLALLIYAWDRPKRWPLFAAGASSRRRRTREAIRIPSHRRRRASASSPSQAGLVLEKSRFDFRPRPAAIPNPHFPPFRRGGQGG